MNHRLKSGTRSSRRFTLLPGNATIRVIVVLVVTAVVALATVVNMAQGDYTNLLIGLVVTGVAAYIGGLWKHSWIPAISIGMMGFYVAPTSFWIPADFLACGLALGMAVTVLMRRALGSPSPPLVVTPGLNPTGMMVLLCLYFLYLLFQAMVGEAIPVYAGQYNIRNTAKAYAEDMLPVLTLVTLIILRYRLPSMDALAKGVSPAMLGAMIALCSYRIYEIAQGQFDLEEETEGMMGPLVPVINLIPGQFAIRVASPIAAIWAASRLFSPHEKLSKSTWLLNATLLAVAFAGSLLSAGRAVPAITLVGVCAMAFLLRRYGLLFVATGVFIVFVCAVNIAGPAIDRMSYSVRRSVAMLRFDDNADKAAITGSTIMRQFLVEEGMKEVRSQPRILLTGRGVLQFTAGDAAINQSKADYEKWMLAVRTGRLHKTSVSHLVRYGALGVGLYYLCQFAALLYCFKVYRHFKVRKMREMSVAAFAFTIMGMNTSIGFLQDAAFSSVAAWFVALLVGVVTKQGAPVLERFEAPAESRGSRMPMSGGLAPRRY
jgi:hypothetical protein